MPPPYRYDFRDGRLYLERGDGAFRIEPWPRPRCMVRLPGADWIPCPPPVRLLPALRQPRPRARSGGQLEIDLRMGEGAPANRHKYEALRRFRSHLPPALAKRLESFHELQWQVLVACSLSERFVDLLESTPALAWLWLARCHERGFCQAGADAFFTARAGHDSEAGQRTLLRNLELPPSRSVLKLLRRCHLPALNTESADALLKVLRDERRSTRLRHLPRLGRGILELARESRILQACTPALLLEVAACRRELHRAPTARLFQDHFSLLGDLGMPLPRPLTSRAELQQQNHELTLGFHDKLRALQESVAPPPPVSELLGRPLRPRPRPAPDPAPAIPSRPRRRKTDPVLPDPPFAGNQHLVPLTTCAHLRVEGRVQSNCVASYASRIKKGTCYIYRVLWPERCTLSIVKGRDGGWRCSELKRARNGRASADTLRFVETWLRQSQEPAADPESENHQLALRPPR